MRTTIDINERLLGQVMSQAGVRTKREAVALSLKAFIRQRHLERLARRLSRGGLHLSQADVERMRAR